MQQFTPEQMKLFQSMFGQLGPDSFLGKLASGDQSQFEQLEAPAWRQFQEAQGGLASRFSGAGMGGRHSSGFQNAANQQSMDFASQLQSQRMGLQQQALQSLMGMSNQLLQQRPYEQLHKEALSGRNWWVAGWMTQACGHAAICIIRSIMVQIIEDFGAKLGQGIGQGLRNAMRFAEKLKQKRVEEEEKNRIFDVVGIRKKRATTGPWSRRVP